MKVRCISKANYAYITYGKEYTTHGTQGVNYIITNDRNGVDLYLKDCFEIVEENEMKANGTDANGNPKNFTDADLKEGMVVKLRDGMIGMVTREENGDFAVSYLENTIDHCTWMSSASIKNEAFVELDIVEVYNKRHPQIFFKKTLEEDKLIWKANPEMTEQQKRIQELEDTIAKAQEQIKAIKEGV